MRNKKNPPEQIRYQCDNCGTEVSAAGEIPRCMGCGKALCEICQNYFLCPQDFHRLNIRHQKKIRKLSKSLENAKQGQKMFTFMPPIFGGLGAILLLLLIFLRGFIFYFLFGFLGGSFVLIAVVFYFSFRNLEDREEKRVKQAVKDIIIPYNIVPTQVTNRKIEEKRDPGRKDQFCQSCGERVIDPRNKVCEFCGERIS